MNTSTIVSNLVNAAASATHLSDTDSDFETIVQSTRQSFRRNSSQAGRKKASKIKKNVIVCIRANVDFLPAPNELKYLEKGGIGKGLIPLHSSK